MAQRYIINALLALSLLGCARQYDVVVIGGGAGGTTAAIEAARGGARVLVVEQTPWLGGMLTSAGVSAIDGNYRLRGGALRRVHGFPGGPLRRLRGAQVRLGFQYPFQPAHRGRNSAKYGR